MSAGGNGDGQRTGRGLVLAGGAVRGAFQAGVISALDRAGVRFDAIVGASVGAVNGAAICHGYGPRLPDMWVESLRDVRWFDARQLLRGRSPFLISEAMRTMVSRYGDIRRVREHPTELLISVTEWDTGRNVLFSSKEGDWTDEERVLHFLASLTIPFVCRERIVIRGTRYCDGAMSANFPVDALLARGCREILIVDPSPTASTALAPLLAPLARGLGAVPLAPVRLAGGILRAMVSRPPAFGPDVVVRVLMPGRPLGMRALDFTSLDAIRAALDLGVETGEAVAREMAPPPTRADARFSCT